MRSHGVFVRISFFLLLTVAALALAAPLAAQELNPPEARWQDTPAVSSVPPGDEVAVLREAAPVAADEQGGTPAQDAPASTQSATPSQPAPQPAEEKSRYEKAEEQVKQQEKQRVLGVVPSFNVSYRTDAVSLSGGQKMRLALRTTIDPVTIAAAFLVAGYHEGLNDLSGFSWGPKGYFERTGVAYLDSFSSTIIGNGILPALLHQDPRYFRLGHGTVRHRMLYSVATAFVCKHDNTGKWEPSYSNVGGNIISGALSNLYYPGSNSGVGLTISNGMIATAEGAIGSVFQEFWPDISRHWLHRDPTHGLDQQNAAGNSPAPVLNH
jgi:hypothetical protein